jgi:hypothetical protein
MTEWFNALSPADQLRAGAFIGAAIAFTIGLAQYIRAQAWKRTEWVAEEMESFFNDSRVMVALRMIDYGERRLEFYPSRGDEAARFVMVLDDDVARALEHHIAPEGKNRVFTDDELTIRDLFDHLLNRLERIHSFIRTGLLGYRDVRPYLDYWAIQVVEADVTDPKVHRIVALRHFMEIYGYHGVRRLFSKLARHKWPVSM